MGALRTNILFFTLIFITTIGSCAGIRPDDPVSAESDLTVNGTDIANLTVPAEYRPGGDPVRIEVTVSDTLLPGPKGEMQAGPRSIGVEIPPVILVLSALALMGIAALTWFFRNQVPAEEENEDNGSCPEREE